MSEWIKKAEEPETLKPLPELDLQRQPPPPNPTGIPDAKPMPMSELLRLLEGSSKALLDAGLDLEKGVAGLLKVKTMSGSAQSERDIMTKTSQYADKIAAIKAEIVSVAKDLTDYRESLTTAKAKKNWW